MTSRILPVVFILIALGVFFTYTHPTYTGDIATLQGDIRGLDAALAAARQFDEKRQALNTEREAIAPENLERINAFLPDGVDNVQLILDLDSVAQRSGIELANFDVAEEGSKNSTNTSEVVSDRPYESLELSVTGIGTYEAFQKFLDAIEWSLRPLDLISLSVDNSQTGVYSYDMTFRIYWLR